MTTIEFKEALSYLQDIIKGTHFENHVYIVGGSVRDYLMHNDINDIDIAVDLQDGGKEFANWITAKNDCLSSTNPCTFGRADTYRFHIPNNPKLKNAVFDCVQTRLNPSYAVKEGESNLGNIISDGELRDLTINAMYLDVSTMEIFDFFNCGKDLEKNLLRTPSSNPSVTFKDDPLRMMRVIRFSTIYGWEIEKDTWMGILKNHSLIKSVSVERFREEFNKILLSPCPSVGLNKMLYSGILYDMLPQLYELNHTSDNQFDDNVWVHTLMVIHETKPTLVNRLSALFHDVGKPKSRKFVNGLGRYVYYGHDVVSADIASTIMRNLKYPKLPIDCVQICIKNHMALTNTANPSHKSMRKFLANVGKLKPVVMDLMRANAIAKGSLDRYLGIEKKLQDVSMEMDYANIKLPINGNEICQALNIQPSPVVGKILEEIKDNMLTNPNLTKEDALSIAKLYHAQVKFATSQKKSDMPFDN